MEQKRRKWNRNVNTMVISCFNFLLHKYCHCFHFPVNIISLLLHYHCFHNYGNVPSGAVILLFYSIVFYWLWPTGPIRCPDCLLQTSRRIKKLLLCNSMKSGAIGARATNWISSSRRQTHMEGPHRNSTFPRPSFTSPSSPSLSGVWLK